MFVLRRFSRLSSWLFNIVIPGCIEGEASRLVKVLVDDSDAILFEVLGLEPGSPSPRFE